VVPLIDSEELARKSGPPVDDTVDHPAVRRTILTKGHCKDCSHYHCCPRMRGENMCYSLKEVPEPVGELRED
jgi:hypothetical protein